MTGSKSAEKGGIYASHGAVIHEIRSFDTDFDDRFHEGLITSE